MIASVKAARETEPAAPIGALGKDLRWSRQRPIRQNTPSNTPRRGGLGSSLRVAKFSRYGLGSWKPSQRSPIGSYRQAPWPYDLVKRAGHAVLRGERRFELEPSGHEPLLDPSALNEQDRNEALAALENIETRFDAMHEGARKILQPYIKTNGLQNAWPTGAEFLERHWNSSDMAGHFAGLIWNGLKLPGEAPVQELLRNETWKMFIDAEGIAVYERAIAREQPKRVHRMDLLQLVYLSGSGRRIFAAADEPLLRGAKQVLIGRYNNVRVLHIRELLEG